MWLTMTERMRPLPSGIRTDVTQKENIRLALSISEPEDGHEKFMNIFNNTRSVQRHDIQLWKSNEFFM